MKELVPGQVDQKGLDEQIEVKRFLEAQLEGERLIEVPQERDCQIAVVIPVYDESADRIITQVQSLITQEGVTPESFEVVYVVNSGEDDGSERFQEAQARNEEVLRLPIWKNRESAADGFSPEQREAFQKIRGQYNFFVIDKTSPGNRLSKSGVGPARGRGIFEVGKRFIENGKNGIVIQTDADSRFEDPHYLEKVKEALEDSSVIGISGDVVYEFSPDEKEMANPEKLRREWMNLVLMKTAKRISQFLYRQKNGMSQATGKQNQIDFSGANMITRSYETVLASQKSNWNTLRAAEDTILSRAINQLAVERGQRAINMRDQLKMVTALRESDRTPVPLKKRESTAISGEPVVRVDNLDTEEEESRPLYEYYREIIRRVQSTEEGRIFFEKAFQQALSRFRDPTGQNNFEFLRTGEIN